MRLSLLPASISFARKREIAGTSISSSAIFPNAGLTSNSHRASEPGNVLLDVGEANVPEHSVVVVSQISSVDKARLGERIGTLSDARVEQILAGLRFQQVSFFER